VAFLGSGCPICGYTGLFYTSDGHIKKVIDNQSTLDGKSVTGLDFGWRGLSADQVAFLAFFSDNSSGIYVANLPEPSQRTFLAFGVGLLLLIARRKTTRGDDAS